MKSLKVSSFSSTIKRNTENITAAAAITVKGKSVNFKTTIRAFSDSTVVRLENFA